MISYITHSEIDKALWDQRIAASPQGEVYAFSWFLDIVSPGWDALVSENYNSVFPLTKRKKFSFDYLCQPYFTQQLGLFSNNKISENDLRHFIEAIPGKFKLVEIQLNTGNHFYETNKFQLNKRLTHHLDLSPDYEKLRSGFSENLRRNLKKAASTDTILFEDCKVKSIITLFRNNRGHTIENLNSDDYTVFEKLLETAKEKNLLEIICVKDQENELLAGAIFIKSVHSWIFLFSATSDEGKQTGAMSKIVDSFIHRHSGEKMSLDFEGSMDKNLARYYKSFGSKEVVYLQVHKNNLPSLIRWLK